MKRFRGPLLMVLSVAFNIPLWFYYQGLATEARKTPFGSEFGSVAWPPRLWFTLVKLSLAICFITGLVLIVVDWIEWLNARKHA